MNTYSSNKADTGWIICPSKTFRGKFYYFNVNTGETAWCLDENESKSLKDPRLQRADHDYPEPNSPPNEVIRTGSNNNNYQQPFMTPNYERTISNYPINMYQNTAQNFNPILMQPFDQITNSMPCQIQFPMQWPGDNNLPQMVMIFMNRAMGQLAIDEQRQAFRQPNYALEPNRAFRQPNYALEPNRAWKEPYHVPEPNRAWKEPNQVPVPNRAWIEPNHAWKGSNQSPMEPKEPDRGVIVHSGKTPLCKRFTNFQKPVLEVKDNGTVNGNKYDLSTQNQWDLSDLAKNQCNFSAKNQSDKDFSTKKSYEPTFSHNQSIDNPESSTLNQNQHQPKTLLCEEMEKIPSSNPYFNIAKKSPEKFEPNHRAFMPNASNSDFSQIYSNTNQNLPKLEPGLFSQNQKNNNPFGQSQPNKEFFGQSQTKSLIGDSQAKQFQPFKQSQTNEGLFGQSQPNKEFLAQSQTKQLFGQSQTNKDLFGQNNTNKELFRQGLSKHKLFGQKGVFGQSQMNKNLDEQSQTNQLFITSQACSEIFPNLESNSFQKLNAGKSTLKQSVKVDFPKKPQPNVEIPSCSEEKDTYAKEKSALTLNNKAESKDTDIQKLDKNDLRMILMEKKRKSNVLETTNTIEAKKIKTSIKQYTTATVPKKKVTFNLEPEHLTISENGDGASYKGTQCQGLSPPSGESWYVVTDVALLENFDVLDNFVKSDPKCNLMIPSGVMSDIVALSRGECRERSLVTLARHLLRGLATSQPHIIVQESADMSLDISTEDSILNCYLELADDAYVVLITNDEDLQTRAEYLNMNCFTFDQIKNSQAKQPEVHFDVKKVQISITNEPDIDIPTKKFESLSFGIEHLNLDQNKSSSNYFKNLHNSKSGEPELQRSANGDYENSKADTQAFEIQKNARDYAELDTTTLKKRFTVPNSNETTETETKPLVFKKENNTNKEKQSTTNQNTVNQSEPSIFDGKPNNQEKPSIYGTETRANQPKPITEKENVKLKSKYLEQFLKRFCEKNEKFKYLVDERRDEVGCSFEQIMEDCLNNVLQDKTNMLIQKLGSSPPWTLTEALQCLTFVYDTHTYIQEVVSVFTSVLKFKCVTAKDILKTIGCGIALLKYLKFITPTADILKDAEDALGTILQNLTVDTDIEPNTPSFQAHISQVERNKPTTVKDRSEVVKYLKKHFNAWAEYDETLEESSEATQGNNDKDPMILRTYGRNLGSLKLNNSKPMTFEPDSQNIENTTKNYHNIQENVTLENEKTEIENMDVENVILNKDLDKNSLFDLKLTRSVENATAKTLQDNINVQLNSTKENKANKQTEPKVIRLSSNIDFDKSKPKNAPEKLVLDDFSTHGHTFGSMQSGQKIIRYMKPIKEFEKKIKFQRKPLDLDGIDYSIMSKSDENNNSAVESTNNSCLSMSLEHNNDSIQKTYLDPINEHSDVKNDCDAKNYRFNTKNDWFDKINLRYDTQNDRFDAKNDRFGTKNDWFDTKNDRFDATNDSRNHNNYNSTATNKNHSITLEKRKNNIYDAVDDILTANDVVHSIYYNNFDSEITNDNYETNDNFVIETKNDNFKRLSYGKEINDEMNDVIQNDDVRNDNEYESPSQQAYYVMDTFLSDLKLAFKAMHKFLENSVHELRSGELPASTRRIISNTATKTRATLDKIMANLGGIIHRETYGGTKLKDLVAGAGSNNINDERIVNYREIVSKCYDHAMLIEHGLRAVLAITDA